MAMDPRLKAYLREKIPDLKASTNCNENLLDRLVAAGVYTSIDKDEILSKPTQDSKNSDLYYKLLQKSLKSYEKTVDILDECEYAVAADLLRAGLTGGGGRNRVEEIDFIKNMTKLNVVVKPSPQFMENLKTDYKMRSNPRGLALIISNTRFPNSEPKHERRGGEKDHEYMLALLQDLQYKCDIQLDIKRNELESVLERFKNDLENHYSHVDSLVVAVMSHGSRDFIEMADGRSVHLWTDIIYKFKDVLPKKPKIFIIQACQDFEPLDDLVVKQTDAIVKPMTDTLICFPTQPGAPANRDFHLGTWFIYCLTKVFMENAHDTHLMALMKLVQTRMNHDLKVEHDEKQLCHWYDYLDGCKKVYFNPGK